MTVDGAAALPPSRTSACIFFPSEVAHQGGFPLLNPVPSSSRWWRAGGCARARAPSPPPLVLADSSLRHRRGGEGVRRRGALGVARGVRSTRYFYAGDGAVCRGSISEQRPLDFQGF